MATKGVIDLFLNALPSDARTALSQVFDYVLGNLRFGRVVDAARTENFQAYYFAATTPSTANEEFSIRHGMNQAPYLLVPVLPLDSTGYQVARLKTTRTADAQRAYLSSPDTNAAIAVMMEF